VKHTGISRTYTRLMGEIRRWTPDTTRVLRGGLRATLMLEVCALVLWGAATPFRAELYDLWRSVQAIHALIPATLAITLAGGVAVEYTARRAKQ